MGTSSSRREAFFRSASEGTILHELWRNHKEGREREMEHIPISSDVLARAMRLRRVTISNANTPIYRFSLCIFTKGTRENPKGFFHVARATKREGHAHSAIFAAVVKSPTFTTTSTERDQPAARLCFSCKLNSALR